MMFKSRKIYFFARETFTISDRTVRHVSPSAFFGLNLTGNETRPQQDHHNIESANAKEEEEAFVVEDHVAQEVVNMGAATFTFFPKRGIRHSRVAAF